MSTPGQEAWGHGDRYEPYVGRWSRLVARDFLDWLGVPGNRRWLDVGSGTGALAGEILARTEPTFVVGVDRSEGYVRHAGRRLPRGAAAVAVADAGALPVATARVDAAVSGLVLNFVSSPVEMLAEMRRVTVRGGMVAVYVWDYAGEMQLMRHFWDAAAALDPEATALDEGRRFPMCNASGLARLFHAARLPGVVTRPIDVPTVFRDFDDYWAPFLGAQGPAPGYCAALPEPRRVALRDALRARLPVEADGSIRLSARAWAARAIVG